MRENECFGLRVARRGRWHFPCRYSDRRQPEVPEEDQKHAPCTRGVYFSTRGSRGGAELPAFRAPRLRKLRLSIPCCHMTSKAMKTAKAVATRKRHLSTKAKKVVPAKKAMKRRFFVALPFHSNKRAMASGAAGGAPLAPREGSAAAASVAEPPAAPGAASHLVSGTDRVMCQSLEMEKACPERKRWLCHSGNDLTFETCTACGAEWRFWQDVIQKEIVITGYHRGGAVQCRTAGSCETCQVVWVVP